MKVQNAPAGHATRTLISVAAFLYMSAVQAGSPATFTVGATVLRHVALNAAQLPASLTISAADVERGYVDAPAPTRFVVSSNDPRGFALDVFPASEVFTSVSARGAAGLVFIGRDGGTIVQRAPALPLTLAWRFTLAPGTAPGVYPWPLQYAVRALDPNQ